MDEKTARIRELNDQLRKNLSLGTAVMTPGIAALGPEAVERIVHSISAYELFTESNDPHGEHDFGSFKHDGRKVFFKIDYYDRTMEFASADPSDPMVTTRVLTVMLASEY